MQSTESSFVKYVVDNDHSWGDPSPFRNRSDCNAEWNFVGDWQVASKGSTERWRSNRVRGVECIGASLLGSSICVVLVRWCRPNSPIAGLGDHVVRDDELSLVAHNVLVARTIKVLDARSAADSERARWIEDLDFAEQVDDAVAVSVDDAIAIRSAYIELLLEIKLVDHVTELVTQSCWGVTRSDHHRDISKGNVSSECELQGDSAGSIGDGDGFSCHVGGGQACLECDRGAVRTAVVVWQRARDLVPLADFHLVDTGLGRSDIVVRHDDFIGASTEFSGPDKADERIRGTNRTPGQVIEIGTG